MGSMWDNTKKPDHKDLIRSKDVKFFVDGECVSPGVVLEVAEESNYMADYVIGKGGELTEIRFDRIDQE